MKYTILLPKPVSVFRVWGESTGPARSVLLVQRPLPTAARVQLAERTRFWPMAGAFASRDSLLTLRRFAPPVLPSATASSSMTCALCVLATWSTTETPAPVLLARPGRARSA